MNGRARTLLLLLSALLLVPAGLAAQGIAIGARVGTLGAGGELALGISESLVLRGGVGVVPLDYTGTFDQIDYTVTFPSTMATVGIDLYPGGGSFRIMGGLLWRSDDVEMEAPLTGSVDIGGTTYTETGTLKGVLVQKSVAPYAGIGFGKHTAGGIGLFLDLGVAVLGEPDVQLTASGAVANVPGIQQDLNDEAQQIEDDVGAYLKFWPIINLGIRIPLG